MSPLDAMQPPIKPRGDATPIRGARDDTARDGAGRDGATGIGDDRPRGFGAVLGSIDEANAGGATERRGDRRTTPSDDSDPPSGSAGTGAPRAEPAVATDAATQDPNAAPPPAATSAGDALQSLMALARTDADPRSTAADTTAPGIDGLVGLIERAAAPPPRSDAVAVRGDRPGVSVVAQATHFAPVRPVEIPPPTAAAPGTSTDAPAAALAIGSPPTTTPAIEPAIVLRGPSRSAASPSKRGAATVAASPATPLPVAGEPASPESDVAGPLTRPAAAVGAPPDTAASMAAGSGAITAAATAGVPQTAASSTDADTRAAATTGSAEPTPAAVREGPIRAPGPLVGETGGQGAAAAPMPETTPGAAESHDPAATPSASALPATGLPATGLPAGTLHQIVAAVASEAAAVQSAATALPAGQAEGPLRLLTLQLHPAELGAVLVRMRLQDGQLAASLHAAREETAELLRKDGHVLADLLKSAGYRPDTVTIQAASHTARSEMAQNGGQAPGEGGSQRSAFPTMADGRGQGGATSDQPSRRAQALTETHAIEAREQDHEATSAARGGLYI